MSKTKKLVMFLLTTMMMLILCGSAFATAPKITSTSPYIYVEEHYNAREKKAEPLFLMPNFKIANVSTKVKAENLKVTTSNPDLFIFLGREGNTTNLNANVSYSGALSKLPTSFTMTTSIKQNGVTYKVSGKIAVKHYQTGMAKSVICGTDCSTKVKYSRIAFIPAAGKKFSAKFTMKPNYKLVKVVVKRGSTYTRVMTGTKVVNAMTLKSGDIIQIHYFKTGWAKNSVMEAVVK